MYEVINGEKELMENVAQKGVRALNPNTGKWEIINKKAKYEVRVDNKFYDEEGREHFTGTLLSDINLRKTAKEKGLIL